MTKTAQWMGLIVILLLSVFTPAAVVHRYSFTGTGITTVVDSIGGADGTLVGDAAISGDVLVLDGTDDWVELPANVLGDYTSATVEAWFTLTTSSGWNRLFDFGDTSGVDGGYYWFYSPSGGGSCSRLAISTGGYPGYSNGEETISPAILSASTTYHIVCVYDAANSQMRLYQNGSLMGSCTVTMLLSDVHRVYAYIGRSVYPGDPELAGSINEFRIHNSAMTDTQVAASYAAGPDTVAGAEIAPSAPLPANGSTSQDTSQTLSWTSDPNSAITGHHIYLGTDHDSVMTATTSSAEYLTTTAASVTSYSVSLQTATQYYWRVEDVYSSGTIVSSDIWSFSTYDPKATTPVPASGTIGISVAGTTLQWTAGENIAYHRIYFGASEQSLSLIKDNYTSTSLATGALSNSKVYYWRVDECESDSTVTAGDVWNFTTMEEPQACLPGDLDGDCFVGIEDLRLFAAQWLVITDCDAYSCPDLDQNNIVNLSDLAILAGNWQQSNDPQIIINEIHYHSDSNIEPVEFIELYNAGAVTVDLSGWHLEDAVSYTIPAGVTMAPGAYLVIGENPTAINTKFGVTAYGPWTGKLSNEGEKIVLRDAFGNKINDVEYSAGFPWPTAADGEGASLELVNPNLDNDLGGSWRPSGYHNAEYDLAFGVPTPGQVNSSYAITSAVPPQMRQVDHEVVSPVTGQETDQPCSGQSVKITVKVTDPDGVGSVVLKYQIVSAGSYVPAYLPVSPISTLISYPTTRRTLNSAFEAEANWTSVTMVDDGTGNDVTAGDNTYTAVIPGQSNRTLVRYRIVAADTLGNTVRVPYYDDGAMNFAYFVYNGVPAYVASTDTVQAAAPYTYSADIMNALPTYTLITRTADLYQCNGYNSSDRIDQATTSYNNQEAGKVYNWEGAFVYNGKVYDHINYRLRGGNGRYSNGRGGKRSMKFRFNRGDYFQARDIYGEKFPSKWQHLVTGKMLGNWYGYSGFDGYMYGVNELMNMKLWNIADVPAPEGLWFTFRVIDGADETPSTSSGQYDGDFYGLYIAWEDYDNAFLQRQGLPEGNLYKLSDKIYEGYRQLRFQAPNAVSDASDYENIRWNMTASATADFIETYMNTDEWSRYHTIVEAIRCYDIFSGSSCTHCLKNCAWYFYPNYTAANNYLGEWWLLPFDVDDTWGPYFNKGVDHGKAAIYDQLYITEGDPVQYTVQTAKAPIKQAYRNYIREFRDLFWQQEIVEPMIDELAAVIQDIVPADRDRWRLEPGFTDAYRSDPGPLETVVSNLKSFAFQPTSVFSYWVGSSNNLDTLANAENDSTNIPNTPTISYTGITGYPSNALTFSTSTFSDPQGSSTFAAYKWRIAEYEDLVDSSPDGEVVLVNMGSTGWKYFKGTEEPSTIIGEWRQIGFNDSSWISNAAMPIGYSSGYTFGTTLSDMRYYYTTVYLRKTFEVNNPAAINGLSLTVRYDDGYNIWINGTRVAYVNVSTEDLACTATATTYIGSTYATNTHTLSDFSSYLVSGENVIAIQFLNQSKSSSDLYCDISLTATYTETPTQQKIKKHKYEINPVWESDDITDSTNLTVQIPASVVKPGRLYRVRSRAKDSTGRWSHWSSPIQFTAGDPVSAGILADLRITEMMYNPAPADTSKGELNLDNNEFEFIELKNCSVDSTLDLTYLSFTAGVTFNFAGSAITSLAPGEFVLVVRNASAFNSRYSGLSGRIAGTYSGKLDNSGEQIVLVDYWNGTIADFEYSDGIGWPISADGAGHSIVPIDSAITGEPEGSLQYGGNWRASTYMNGSPGADDPAPAAGLVINEIMAHTDYSNASYPDYDSNDWIELYNTTGSAITLGSGWYLSDDADELDKWAIPSSTVVAAYGRVSFDEITGFHSPITSGFGLDKSGEYVFLSYLPGTSANRVVDYIKFGGQYNSISTGRYPDGGTYWFKLAGTCNTANAGPVQPKVVINEIMYHPQTDTDNDEYIELYNPTTTTVSLYNANGTWRLNGGITHTLPGGINLAAGGKVVLVGFDPAVDTARLAAFNTAYGCSLVANTNIFGPWSGNLSNGGERIALQEPQEADPPSITTVWWIDIDAVMYGDYYTDEMPWPMEPDGTGMVLERISSAASASGNDPGNWQAADPSPGN